MNPDSEEERTTPFPGPNARPRPPMYKFNRDELRVLSECNRESFYQRSLPFASLLGGSVYYAIKTGKLSGSTKFGAIPKVSVAVIIGYIVGKMSYQKVCMEKFMALPNSKVGDMLRARRSGNLRESHEPGFGSSISLSPFSGVTDSYSDIAGSNRDYDYDSRPQVEGLDDSFRPSVDNPITIQEEDLPPVQKHVTTYEELRKKNREEYAQSRLANYREYQARTMPSQIPPQPSTTNDKEFIDEYKSTIGTKNKYGDTWG